MDDRSLARLRRELEGFVGELLADLPRRDRRAWAAVYLRGLLLDGNRKSIRPVAGRLEAVGRETAEGRADYERAPQQFVYQSTRPADAVRDRLRRWLAARGRRRPGVPGGTPHRFLIPDDTGFPEQGTASVGVARQYTGTPGEVASCRVAVTLQYARQPAEETAAGGEVFCADARLYPPGRGRCDDRRRLDKAGVPEEVGYQPKWRTGLDMLRRARADGLGATVLADSLFGSVTAFRRGPDDAGWTWCVGVGSTLAVIDAGAGPSEVPAWSGQGRPPTRPARAAAKAAGVSAKQWAAEHAKDFRAVNWRAGSRVRKGRAGEPEAGRASPRPASCPAGPPPGGRGRPTGRATAGPRRPSAGCRPSGPRGKRGRPSSSSATCPRRSRSGGWCGRPRGGGGWSRATGR